MKSGTGPPYKEGKGRPKKEADHSRRVGDSFNEQGSLYRRLVLGSYKITQSLQPHAIALEVYRETLTSLSRIYCLDGHNNTLLSRGWSLKTTLTVGQWTEHTFPKQGRRWASSCLGPADGSPSHHVFLMTTPSSSIENHLFIQQVFNELLLYPKNLYVSYYYLTPKCWINLVFFHIALHSHHAILGIKHL